MRLKNIQISKFNQLIKSQFVEMFGDPNINNKNWKKRKLFDECEIITGNTPSRKIESYYGNYIEWIKSDNINEEKTYLTTAKEYLSEDGLTTANFKQRRSFNIFKDDLIEIIGKDIYLELYKCILNENTK